jgi:5'-3' exonuclease
MNQQRSRRFRAAQEAKERKTMMEEVVEEMKSLGCKIIQNYCDHIYFLFLFFLNTKRNLKMMSKK